MIWVVIDSLVGCFSESNNPFSIQSQLLRSKNQNCFQYNLSVFSDWSEIKALIGLFLFFVTFAILSGLGIFLDKSQGEAKCRLMRDRLNEIMANKLQYNVVEVTDGQSIRLGNSDLCLGNIWLKYSLELGNTKFYFEESKYAQIEESIQLIRGI